MPSRSILRFLSRAGTPAGFTSPPQASRHRSHPKPHQCDIKATSKRVDSQAIGTSKPPQGYLKAPTRLPQGSHKAPPKPPRGEGRMQKERQRNPKSRLKAPDNPACGQDCARGQPMRAAAPLYCPASVTEKVASYLPRNFKVSTPLSSFRSADISIGFSCWPEIDFSGVRVTGSLSLP